MPPRKPRKSENSHKQNFETPPPWERVAKAKCTPTHFNRSMKNENAAAKSLQSELPGLFLKIVLVFKYNDVKKQYVNFNSRMFV